MGRAPEGEVWDLSCQGLFRRHEWEAGNRPVSGCTSLHAAKARQADWILETSVVQALSSLHLEGMAGRAVPPASNSLPAAQAAHLERTTFIVDRGNCRLNLGE